MTLRKQCSWLLPYLQSFRLYRTLGRRLIRKRIRCCFATAAHAHGLSRFFGYSEAAYEGRQHRLVATLGGHIAGVITIRCFDGTSVLYPGWWAFELVVRIPYRGLGIGEQLMQKVIEESALVGATRLSLLVSENNRRAIYLYQKLGLELYSIPRLDAHLKNRFRRTGDRRIIMSIPIGNSLHSNDNE